MENPATAAATTLPTESTPAPKVKQSKRQVSNRTLILGFIAAFILGSAYGYRSLFIAATIDGQPVSRLAVIRQLEKQGGENALNALITERLIAAEAVRAGVVVDPADVDKEIENIKSQVSAQGMTLDDALAQQGMTLDDVREQITTQQQLKLILGDSLNVTDADIDDYIAKTKLTVPKNMSEEDFRSKIKAQLNSQKFGTEADRWITGAREKADIKYFVGYGKAPVTEPATATGSATP
ncbi:MAG: SurA N-terminal domain-containing protein [Candidatus Moraniibacteriota bacterium]